MAELNPLQSKRKTLWVSGLAAPNTGVGVFQQQIYPRLARHFNILTGPRQDRPETKFGSTGPIRLTQNLIGWSHELLALPRGDVALVTTNPAPARMTIPTVGVVYDLRWQRTRRGIGLVYRHAELRHLVRRSTSLIAISERTREDLVARFPEAQRKTTVVHLGPGLVEPGDLSAGDPKTVMLIGSAKYKRNELAALALANARPSWATRFIGLSVSAETRSILESNFGRDNCEWYSAVEASFVAGLYRRAGTYIGLSMEEGFGQPFIEALASGCQVIAIRQPLTDALLNGAGILIADGTVGEIASQLRQISPNRWPSVSRRQERADHYSWENTVSLIEASLHRAIGNAESAV